VVEAPGALGAAGELDAAIALFGIRRLEIARVELGFYLWGIAGYPVLPQRPVDVFTYQF